jgi:proteic killer suppression protein
MGTSIADSSPRDHAALNPGGIPTRATAGGRDADSEQRYRPSRLGKPRRHKRKQHYRRLYAERNAYYPWLVIKSFADKVTAALFSGRRVRSLPPDIHRRAYAKLQALDAADTLDFLRVPPSNRLEQLRGDREGQWSIRINDQWRICFRWEGRDAYDVEVTDYH